MSGIAGLVLRAPGPAGEMMARLLRCLQNRGPDSAGMAVYGDRRPGLYTYSVVCQLPPAERAAAVAACAAALPGAPEVTTAGSYAFMTLAVDSDPLDLVLRIESQPGLHVVGVGQSMFLVKDVGTVAGLCHRYRVDRLPGRFAVGHTRLATESRVDVLHSHPLWSRYVPDVCIAHNGQVTNDVRMRQALEAMGYRFITGNDSEVIAVYLAHRLRQGRTLRGALADSARDLDGSFTYIAATPAGVGVVRDPLGIRPVVVAETADAIVLATEYPAVQAVAGNDAPFWEVDAGEVYVWP